MSQELATAQFPMSVHTQDDKAWGDVITAASFLPYISLYGGNSAACKEGKIGIGRYGLVRQKDKIEDLTSEFNVLALAWRFKAMQIADGAIISNYNPKTEAFLTIKEKSEVKDSGCMYGIEFLFWVPELPAKCFATFYCNSKTSRREAQNIRPFCPQQSDPSKGVVAHGPLAATLKSQLIKTERYMWHGPVVTQCSTQFELPSMEEMIQQAQKFANPKESEIEAVKSGDQKTRDR